MLVYVHLNFELISWKCLKSFKKNGEDGDLAIVVGASFLEGKVVCQEKVAGTGS